MRVLLILGSFIVVFTNVVNAKEYTSYSNVENPGKHGGCGATCVGCLFGLRAGFMYNEGVKIRTFEWLYLIPGAGIVALAIDTYNIFKGKTWSEVVIEEELGGPQIKVVPKKGKGGLGATCVGCVFGSRVGYQYNEGVKVRQNEWLGLVIGYPFLLDLIDIYEGKTWSEVEEEEGLRIKK